MAFEPLIHSIKSSLLASPAKRIHQSYCPLFTKLVWTMILSLEIIKFKFICKGSQCTKNFVNVKSQTFLLFYLIRYFLYLHFKCYPESSLYTRPTLLPYPPTPASWPWCSPVLGHRGPLVLPIVNFAFHLEWDIGLWMAWQMLDQASEKKQDTRQELGHLVFLLS